MTRVNGSAPVPEQPRRVKYGVKLVSREAPAPTNWAAKRWATLLEQAVPAEAMHEGLVYARAGQTTKLEVEVGTVAASVQGRAPKPYAVRFTLRTLDAAQWERAVAAMAEEAIHAARLLAHELPASLESLFASLGMELLPQQHGAVAFTCSCSEVKPCKHIAAVGHLMTERLSSDPLLLFTLYGMSAEQLLERLRQARAIHTHGAASAHADPMIPESQVEPPPLEACLEDFWRCGPQLAELEHAPPPQHVAHALLRRLGPSPMRGRFPLVGLLASIYDAVSAEAIRIRDHAEHLDDPVE